MKQFTRQIKLPIYAGMQFTYPGTKNNSLKKVGYDIINLIYDSAQMDCLIGEKRIKRVMY